MRSGRWVRGLLPGLALASVVACSDGLTPGLADRYELRSVAGDPLPAVTFSNENVTIRVISSTLHLGDDGTGFVSTVRDTDEPGPDVLGYTTSSTSAITYTVAEGIIRIDFVCSPNASCIVGPHVIGRLDGNRLVVEFWLNERVPQVYERD